MEAPSNSYENSDEESKEPFDFETSHIDSPRLLARAVLCIPSGSKIPTIADSIPTFYEMKSLNAETKCDRVTRLRNSHLSTHNSRLEMARRKNDDSIARQAGKDIGLHMEFVWTGTQSCRGAATFEPRN